MSALNAHGLRLAVAAAAGVAAGFLASLAAPPKVATVIGWNVGALAYAAHVWIRLAPADAETVKAWSAAEDEGRWAITLILTAAVGASFAAIFDMVSQGSSVWILALAALTILSSFALLHTVFAAHYAHRCLGDDGTTAGLDFPGDPPRFVDFAYYAFTIGMTFQTSDVTTKTTEMRALTLVHGAISFVFNTVIIATSVGLASGLIGG